MIGLPVDENGPIKRYVVAALFKRGDCCPLPFCAAMQKVHRVPVRVGSGSNRVGFYICHSHLLICTGRVDKRDYTQKSAKKLHKSVIFSPLLPPSATPHDSSPHYFYQMVAMVASRVIITVWSKDSVFCRVVTLPMQMKIARRGKILCFCRFDK